MQFCTSIFYFFLLKFLEQCKLLLLLSILHVFLFSLPPDSEQNDLSSLSAHLNEAQALASGCELHKKPTSL